MSEHLPHEIVLLILCRLPSKSLLRFRCVCKSWHSLIADHSFISLHRRHSPSFLLLHSHGDDHLLTLSNSSFPFPLPSFSINTIRHCHGLLCLSVDDRSSSFIICNPSLRRFLPLPKLCIHPDWFLTCFAFGFDSRNQDYKIVRLAVCHGHIVSSAAPRVDVFSLASGIWRTFPSDVAPVCLIGWASDNSPYGFVNGIVHWGVSRRERNNTWYFFILSFDFADEVFDEVAIPESLARDSSWFTRVVVIGGGNDKDLTMCHLSLHSGSIWVMKEYRAVESWNKLIAFDLTGSCMVAPSFGMKITHLKGSPMVLSVMKNGEILVLTMEEEEEVGKQCLYLLDVERRRFVNLQHKGLGQKGSYTYADYYAESLILLNNIDALVTY